MGEVGRTVSSVHQAASFAVPFAAMGTAVVAAMAAEGAAGLRRIAGIAESMVVGGAMGRPRIVQHVEETLMAALLHLDAGDGWTEHPPAQNIDEASAILVDVYRESALDCMVAKLDRQHVKCTEIVYRNQWPDQVGRIILRAC